MSGIHRLVYGIYAAYSGQQSAVSELLLVSGSEAFDVGNAVLLGISTDRVDYLMNTEIVKVKLSMHGTVNANLELKLNGATVKTRSVSLDGFKTMNIELDSIDPGSHVLRAILRAGGLESTKETTFIYGSSLPDLILMLSAQQSEFSKDNTMQMTARVRNQGRTPSIATSISLYDGESLIDTKSVNSLNPGESQEIPFNWNILGKAGEHKLKAVVDPQNIVIEFNKENNTAIILITIPEISMTMTTDKDRYKIRDKVNITTTLINLTPQNTYSNLILETKIADSSNSNLYNEQKVAPSLPPSNSAILTTLWDTGGLNEGIYTLTQSVISNARILTQLSKSISLERSSHFELTIYPAYQKVRQGESTSYIAHVKPLDGFNAPVSFNITGLPPGAQALIEPGSLIPPGDAVATVITTGVIPVGSHNLTILAEGGGIRNERATVLDVSGFVLEVNPTSQTVKQLEKAFYILKLLSVNGYGGETKISIDGEQNGIRASLQKERTSVPDSVSLTIETSRYTEPKKYTLTATATDGLVLRKATITLIVEENPDIVCGITTTPGPGRMNPALVSLFTDDMQPIKEFLAYNSRYSANAIMADIDGDGYDEIAVAPGPDPRADAKVRVYRKSGEFMFEQEIFNAKYGLTLSAVDMDGDGKDEIIAGMGAGPRNPSRIKVLSFNGIKFVETGIDFIAFPDEKGKHYRYGVNVAAGDVDGDGIPEIIAGAGPQPKNPARVRVFKVDTSQDVGNWKISPAIADFIASFRDMWTGKRYGVNVAAGDIDGDGVAEIILGAGPRPRNASYVKVYRGNGNPMEIEFIAYPDDAVILKPPGKQEIVENEIEDVEAIDKELNKRKGSTHGVYLTAGDLNGDGIAEIITGPGPGSRNKSLLRIFNAEGTLLREHLVYPDKGYGLKVSVGRTGAK